MPDFPHVILDLHHRALSVLLSDAEIAGTHTFDDDHLVDVDASGGVVGIEILTTQDWKLDEMGAQFGFSEQLPAIRAALDAVLRPTGTAVNYAETMVIDGSAVPAGLDVQEETDASSEHPLAPPVIR